MINQWVDQLRRRRSSANYLQICIPRPNSCHGGFASIVSVLFSSMLYVRLLHGLRSMKNPRKRNNVSHRKRLKLKYVNWWNVGNISHSIRKCESWTRMKLRYENWIMLELERKNGDRFVIVFIVYWKNHCCGKCRWKGYVCPSASPLSDTKSSVLMAGLL